MAGPYALRDDHQGGLMTALAQIRVDRGYTQRDLAAASGYCLSCICEWERGSRQPRLSALEDIAQALGVRIAIVP